MTTLKPSVQHVCKQIIENNSNLTKQYKNQTNLSSLDLSSHSNWIILQFCNNYDATKTH